MVHRLPETGRRQPDLLDLWYSGRGRRPVGQDDARWDLARINDLNEILGFYSLSHWYAWQVSVLGLGPVWLSANDDARKQIAGCWPTGISSASAFRSANMAPTSTPPT